MKNKKVYRAAVKALTIPYGFMVLWLTLIDRITTNVHQIKPPLWEIWEFLHGDTEMMLYTLANMLMLLPLGVLLPVWFKSMNHWKRIAVTAFMVSFAIELAQLLTTRGLFEFDDILTNTIGAVIGYQIGRIIEKGTAK